MRNSKTGVTRFLCDLLFGEEQPTIGEFVGERYVYG
jgi:hypothetical protein